MHDFYNLDHSPSPRKLSSALQRSTAHTRITLSKHSPHRRSEDQTGASRHHCACHTLQDETHWKQVHTQPGDGRRSDRTAQLTSKTVSSQKVRPEATSVSLPAFAGVGPERKENEEKTREKLFICLLQTRFLYLPTRKVKTAFLTLLILLQLSWKTRAAPP